jgi:hypothetical protein
VFLAGSADGKRWKRFSDTPLIPLGANGWDSGMITTAGQPLFLKDEVRVYYGGANFDHAAGEKDSPYDDQNHRFCIGFTTLRKDGFVYATSSNGRFTTVPLESPKGKSKSTPTAVAAGLSSTRFRAKARPDVSPSRAAMLWIMCCKPHLKATSC